MRFLVVGLGSMGKRRIRNLRALGQTDIVGTDTKVERCEEAAKRYGIRTFATFDEAVSQDIDALVISTPPNLHMSFAKASVENGRPFFCEASTSTDGMREVLSIAQKNGVVTAPSCTMRHHPSVKKLKEIVDGSGVGRVLTYTHHAGQWLPDWHPTEDYRKYYVSRRETGACREIVPFELTWLNWVIGARVESVTAMKGKLSDLDCDIDDVYQVLLRYEGDLLGHLQIDVLARAAVRYCRIVGTEGSLEWSITDRTVRHYRADTREWTLHAESAPRIEEGYSEMSNEAMYESEMAAYIAAIRGEKKWCNPLEDEIATLQILLAAERAADQGITQHL